MTTQNTTLNADRPTGNSAGPLLQVNDLHVHFPTDDGLVKSVDGVTFDVEAGKTLGIVGESGSGKSVTSQAIMGLHRGSSAVTSGQVLLDGEDLMEASESRLRKLRGKDVAMIFQDPLSAMHPYYTVGNQIIEAYRVHHPDAKKHEAREKTIDMLSRVGIPNPKVRVDSYPHQFSGGMRQRAMVAMALMNDPKLLIADEPTTALDVTVQAQILELMVDLQKEFHSAIIIITHDLGVVADIADDIMVMYGGRAVEQGDVIDTFGQPQHPYTWGLLNSMPRLDQARQDRLDPIPGNPPSLINLPPGCAFSPRCTYRDRVPGDRCRTEEPELFAMGHLQHARCFLTEADRIEIRGGSDQDPSAGQEAQA
ncbi:ABC transporter ATP-binding protein [Leekyejoonella antrihumi]|uniref:ABC transporter ATP-binding protein n=1 Tax=Leekyejoonella antrihumi TaxID=1660198 RepID=A0A563DX84_9MICO|nr:ABC transporter ATP-binding protein [Leekyejoonella antrihumi]TWP34870.1 ABC transporter ATP-binding protein [Leekyejoonella antrihumi]